MTLTLGIIVAIAGIIILVATRRRPGFPAIVVLVEGIILAWVLGYEVGWIGIVLGILGLLAWPIGKEDPLQPEKLTIGEKLSAGIAALAALLMLLGVPINAGVSSLTGGDNKPTTTTTTTSTTTSTTSTTVPVNAAAVATQVDELANNVPYRAGKENIDWNANAEERGVAAFSQRTLRTELEVGAFLREDSEVGRAAHQEVVNAIRTANYGDDEIARALDGSGYFPIQLTEAAQILGTSYFKDGKVLVAGEWRKVGPNDVFWLFLTKDGKIIKDATVRADCANPGIGSIEPLPKGEGPPSVEVPPSPESPKTTVKPVPPKSPTTTTGKKPTSWECQQNGTGENCPEGVKRVRQDPQDNTTSGVNTGPTPGAPKEAPKPNPVGPAPSQGNPAPAPVTGGYNSGAPTGNKPSGTGTDSNGTTGGAPPTTSGPPDNSNQGGSNTAPSENPW